VFSGKGTYVKNVAWKGRGANQGTSKMETNGRYVGGMNDPLYTP